MKLINEEWKKQIKNFNLPFDRDLLLLLLGGSFKLLNSICLLYSSSVRKWSLYKG